MYPKFQKLIQHNEMKGYNHKELGGEDQQRPRMK